jgi:uncharacterized protein (TIGR02246 family)
MTVSFDDYVQIRSLTARYNLAADAGDLDTFADCFTPDGIFEIEGLARLEGPEALKAMIAALAFHTHHATSDAVITVDGDQAIQTCSFVLYGRTDADNDMTILTTSRYTDQLTRTPKGWRFTERISRTDNNLGQTLADIHPPLLETLAALRQQ